MKNLQLNPRLNKINALAVAALLAFSSAAILAQDSAPAANAPRTDGQIEMDVVQALDGSQALKNDLITAATIQTQVTLSGTVASDADKQLAESIVKKVPGVSGVKNNLKIGNPTDDANAQAAGGQHRAAHQRRSGQQPASARLWPATRPAAKSGLSAGSAASGSEPAAPIRPAAWLRPAAAAAAAWLRPAAAPAIWAAAGSASPGIRPRLSASASRLRPPALRSAAAHVLPAAWPHHHRARNGSSIAHR